MKTLIYMSEELKKRDMDVSRSTIVQQGQEIRYGGPLKLVDKAGKTVARLMIDPNGMPEAPEHHVKAWIETELEVKA